MRTSALWQSETLRRAQRRQPPGARRRRRALPCRRPSLAMLKGKSVWVKDPELAEGDVFCRGSCISDEGGKALGEALKTNTALTNLEYVPKAAVSPSRGFVSPDRGRWRWPDAALPPPPRGK